MKRMLSLLLVVAMTLSFSLVAFANGSIYNDPMNGFSELKNNGYEMITNKSNVAILQNDAGSICRITKSFIEEGIMEYSFEENGITSVVRINDKEQKVYINGHELILENEIYYGSVSEVVPMYDPIMNWYRTVNPMLGTSADYGTQTLTMQGNYALAQAIGSIARSAFIEVVAAAIKYSWAGPAGATAATTIGLYGLAEGALGTYYDNANGIEAKVYYRQYKQAYNGNSSTSQAFRHHFKFYDGNWNYVSSSDPIYESWSTRF